jgi:hypothetical protein
MVRQFGYAAVGLAILAASLMAEPTRVKGVIKSVDPDKGVLTLTIKKADKEFKVTDETKITAAPEGKKIKTGLKSPLFKAGNEAAVTTDTKDGKEVVTLIRVYPSK